MSPVQTTVLAKTDIVGYTRRVSTLSDGELSVLLSEHKNFISEIVANHEGTIVKGEGDSFWIIFRSVTAAALAALAMHDRLRVVQAGRGEEECLAIRVAIAVGDVLHQENDIFGHAVNLLARIEAVTPANETYLSQAAWLVLNKAEIPTAYVDTYTLKGIQEPEKVYKIEQTRTRIIPNQIIVFFDIRGWASFMESHSVTEIEDVLGYYDELLISVCREHGGFVRNVAGDTYWCTFSEAQNALAAVEKVCWQWEQITRQYEMGLSIAVHQGDVNILRAYVYGKAINEAALLIENVRIFYPGVSISGVLLTREVASEAQGTKWAQQIQELDWSQVADNSSIDFLKAYGVHRFIVSKVVNDGKQYDCI